MVFCAKRGKETCTLYEQESPVCIKVLRTYAGIGDAETQSPGMLRKPGDLSQVCPRPKKFKRLATRDTLHGSRPNLQQREPDGRIVPTPPDVWDKGTSTKRCARKKKKITTIHIHIHIRILALSGRALRVIVGRLLLVYRRYIPFLELSWL